MQAALYAYHKPVVCRAWTHEECICCDSSSLSSAIRCRL